MRMLETRRELGFPQKAPTEALVTRKLRSEQLQGHPTSLDVFGEIHGAHRPLADQRLNAEPGEHSSGEDSEPASLVTSLASHSFDLKAEKWRLGLIPQPSNA